MSCQGRRFCMTLNNWSEDEYSAIKSYIATRQFWIIGKEIGKKNNVPHLQIYFESKTAIRFSTIKNLNNRLHIEKAKGNLEQNYNYCSKDNNFETNINPETDFKKTINNKDMIIKQNKEDFEYHYKNHKHAISDDVYNMYLYNFDIDNLNESVKEQVFKDIRIYNECKHCYWCELINKTLTE